MITQIYYESFKMRQNRPSDRLRNKQRAFKLREFEEIDRREDQEQMKKKKTLTFQNRDSRKHQKIENPSIRIAL